MFLKIRTTILNLRLANNIFNLAPSTHTDVNYCADRLLSLDGIGFLSLEQMSLVVLNEINAKVSCLMRIKKWEHYYFLSQLYRSSSFNSSGCGSGGEPADDMYSDVSLEEDVQGLNYKVSQYHCFILTCHPTTILGHG